MELLEDRTKEARLAGILTIRVTKADIDAFASGTMDFDAFRQQADMLVY